MSLEKWKLHHWLLASLLIHACAALPIFLTGNGPYPRPRSTVHSNQKLQIEVYGMLANRQENEKRRGDTTPEPIAAPQKASPPAAQPIAAPKPPIKRVAAKKMSLKRASLKSSATERRPEREAPVESPVKMDKKTASATATAAAPAVASEPAPPPLTAPAGTAAPFSGKGDEVNQRRLSIQSTRQQQDKIQTYLAQLTRQVQNNLVYPKEVRKKGVEGVVRIAFVVTGAGHIKAGSLTVSRSSGFSALDQNAMQSAIDSAPFEQPPKEMQISFDVAFTLDMARSG